MSTADNLEKGYSIASWKDDPWSPEGRERYETALKEFSILLNHPWFEDILEKNKVSILDIGAGKGIGGIALAKALKETNDVNEVKLTMIDLRDTALKDALRFAKEEEIHSAKVHKLDATKAHTLGKFDIVLMYGAILVHFNSWNLMRLFSSATQALEEKGVIIVEEMDRTHILFTRGYSSILVEKADPRDLSISVHADYDIINGSYIRNFIRLRQWDIVSLPLNFRSISTIASILWLFVKNIDIAPTFKPQIYFILGKTPRKKILPIDLEKDPEVVLRKTLWQPSYIHSN